jgi:hypothetical protein
MRALLPILFITLLVSAGVGLALQHVLLSRLRTRHAQTWEALGRPTLFFNNSITNSVAVLLFLWRRDYQTLGDKGSVRLASFLRSYLTVYLVLFVFAVVVFFMTIGSQR